MISDRVCPLGGTVWNDERRLWLTITIAHEIVHVRNYLSRGDVDTPVKFKVFKQDEVEQAQRGDSGWYYELHVFGGIIFCIIDEDASQVHVIFDILT
jgi:hypothetical protein